MATPTTKEALNTFSGGMNLDIGDGFISNNQYRYAENIRTTITDGSTLGSVSPIEEPLKLNANIVGDVVSLHSVRNFAVAFTNVGSKGCIYRLTFQAGDVIENKKIFESDHLFSSTISIVSNYVDSDNIRVYFAEDMNPIRVISIAPDADTYNASIWGNIDALSINSSLLLYPPLIKSIGAGSLKSGRIQYFYSVYSKFGTESNFSSLSPVVDLYPSSGEARSINVLGGSDPMTSDSGSSAGKSVYMSIDIPSNSKYTDIRVYSIKYNSASSEPVISLVADEVLSGSIHYFSDYGSTVLSTMTISEFNASRLYQFSAKKIEAKDGILFAANIKEHEDIFEAYDTRAFAFTSNGTASISRSLDQDIDPISINAGNLNQPIPDDHDCIQRPIYTNARYSDVTTKFDLSGNYGGEGLNVKYNFTNTYLIESHRNYLKGGSPDPMLVNQELIDRRIARIGDVNRSINSLFINSSDNTKESIPTSSIGVSSHTGYLNYANPLLSSRLASYHRDEIYRFAAVLYDDNGKRSAPKWIADIRFPAGYIKKSEWNASPFEDMSEVEEDVYTNAGTVASMLKSQELLVKPLGLKFKFKNIPDGISKVEIVRSKRSMLDKTIHAQGVLNKTGTKRLEYIDTDDKIELLQGENNTLRPHPYIGMGYCVSVSGINVGNSTDRAGFLYHSMLGSSFTGEKNDKNNGRLVVGGEGYNYTDHAYSPSFYNKDFNLFITPEASYYKDAFVDQISKSIAKPILVASDIVFPKSTPALSPYPAAFAPYFGNSNMTRAKVTMTGGIVRSTVMHFAADITDKLYSLGFNPSTSGPLMTMGLVGVNMIALGSLTATNTMITRDASIANITDIYNTGTSSTPNSYQEPTVRAFLSLGGAINHDTTSLSIAGVEIQPGIRYRNRYDYSSSIPVGAHLASSNVGLNTATFKYFCTFNKAKTVGGSVVGGERFELMPQFGTSVTQNKSLYTSVGQIPVYPIAKMAYSGDPDPLTRINDQSSAYVSIDEMRYLGTNRGLLRGDNSFRTLLGFGNIARTCRLSGTHGDGIVVRGDSTNPVPAIGNVYVTRKKYLSDYTEWWLGDHDKYLDHHGSSALATFIMNIKEMNPSIYGGPSHTAKKYSEYIPTGYTLDVSNNEAEGYVFGGDTYIGLFDYSIVKGTDPMPDPAILSNEDMRNTQYAHVGHIGALIPLETSINMRISNSRSYIASGSNFMIQSNPGVYGPGISYGNPFTSSQSMPQFRYNSAYSADQFAKVYITNIDEASKDRDTRVIASEPKSIGERFDSWSIFKPANYIDVDPRHGEITRLKEFNNRLFFWQEDAIGILAVNERSLIQDNNVGALALGTGGILQRYDYLDTSSGLHKGSVGALTTSSGGLYWYDHKRAEMSLYSSQASSVLKASGMQSVFNRNKGNIPMNVPMAYNKKHNEVLLTTNQLAI